MMMVVIIIPVISFMAMPCMTVAMGSTLVRAVSRAAIIVVIVLDRTLRFGRDNGVTQ